MNKIETGDFRRINLTKARNMYAAGKMVFLCASNMSPASIWQPASGICKNIDDICVDETFNAQVNRFLYYNCNKETGRKVIFYEKIA